MFKNEQLIAFGDLHLRWQAGKTILDVARAEGINRAITLGDEAHKIYPIEMGLWEDYVRLFDELRQFRDETPERILTCIVGDKTAGVPQDLWQNYVGVGADGRFNGSVIYHEGNIIAGHNGRMIIDEHGHTLGKRDEYEPLVIFHGHSHSMGVLPKYKWLKDDEFVYWLKKEKKYHLKPHGVYWINPGGNYFVDEEGRNVANFAVYDPVNQKVTLRSIFFHASRIKPTSPHTISRPE